MVSQPTMGPGPTFAFRSSMAVWSACTPARSSAPVRLLQTRAHVPRSLASGLCVLLLFGLLFGGLFFLCRLLCAEAADLARQLPQLAENLAPLFEKLKSRLLALAERLPDGLGTGLRAGVEEFFKTGAGFGAALAILLICCAALAYCQRMMQSSIAYATEHITILPTTDLSGTAPEQETSELEPEPAPDADGKQLPLHTLTPQLQTLYESFTAGRAEPIDETKPIYFFADDFDGDGTTDLMILFETKQEDPDARDVNVSIVSGDSYGGNTITLAAGHGWPSSDTVTPYLVDRTVYVTLTEADGTLHPYSLTIHRTESGMDYTVCSDENVR